MGESPCFEWLAEQIVADTSLSRLPARGTLRVSLKKCGLKSETVTPPQLAVVLRELLSKELQQRGVDDAIALCQRWASDLAKVESRLATTQESPAEIWRRVLQSRT